MAAKSIFLYETRGSDPVAYFQFADAVAQLLKDQYVKSLDELAVVLEDNRVWFDFDVDAQSISIDDGPGVREISIY